MKKFLSFLMMLIFAAGTMLPAALAEETAQITVKFGDPGCATVFTWDFPYSDGWFLQPEDRFITCVFGEFADAEQKRIITKGVYAKMARGDMVRFMAENRIEDPEALKEYDRLGYAYLPERSDELNYVYIRRTA